MADDNTLTDAMTPPDPLFSKAVGMYEKMEQVPAVKQAEERVTKGEAGLQDIYGQEKAAQQQKMGIQQQMLGTAQDYQQKLANVPDLGSQASYFRQSTPLLMLMTAVGGIMGRGGSIAALKAMNGMLEGQMEGNQAKYEMAKKAHDDAIAKIQSEYDTKTAVQQMMLKATEGQIDSFRLAEEASQRAIGADEKAAETAKKGIGNLYRDLLMADAKHKAGTGRLQGLAQIAKRGSDLRTRVDTSTSYEERATDLETAWNALVKKLKKDKKLYAAITTAATMGGDGKIGSLQARINAIASKEVADFNEAAVRMTGPAIAAVNAGLSAGTIRAGGKKFIEQEMSAMPSLQRGLAQAEAAVKTFVKDAKEARKRAKTDAERFNEALRTGDTARMFGVDTDTGEASTTQSDGVVIEW